jgi:hypothetical protein
VERGSEPTTPPSRKKEEVLKVRRVAAAALAAGTALAAMTGVGSAAASPLHHHSVTQLPGDYVGPLQFAVSGHRIAVADSFASALYLVGHKDPIATGPAVDPTNPEQSGDLAGVDIENGRIAYTTSTGDHLDTRLTVLRHGHQVMQVNLAQYEQTRNPDRVNAYGVEKPWKLSPECKADLDTNKVPISYRGEKDSHPYAVAGLRDGSWLVADAGGNDILRVSKHGHISTVAVLPSQAVRITSELAATLNVPHCVGITYRFEPVPTAVEVHDGHVYLTTLPGGAGGLGSVYTLNRHHRPVKIAGGFAQATNLAVSPSGRIYVVELGVGVFTPSAHGPRKVLDVPNIAGAEWAGGHLYVSTAPIAATEGKDMSPGHIWIVR